MASLPSLEPPQTRAVVLDIGKGPEREMAPGPYPVVEMRGIEPLSENLSIRTSPITAFLFTFPQNIAEKQAISLSSFINLFYWQSLQQKVHHLSTPDSLAVID